MIGNLGTFPPYAEKYRSPSREFEGMRCVELSEGKPLIDDLTVQPTADVEHCA